VIDAPPRLSVAAQSTGQNLARLKADFERAIGFTGSQSGIIADDRHDDAGIIEVLALRARIYLGSSYVNDFDFNNRSYRVYVQADKAYRSDPRDLGQYYARTTDGQMVPLGNVVRP
jgi:hypothetical protein